MSEQEVRTRACPDGPLLVRGATEWPGPDGEAVAVTRPVVAVCRCERSQRLPWCDGTHRFLAPGAAVRQG
ncbi:CDGSH iron-sulfur domain-containing protein [Nocardioides sp. Bht2]|uniref:CDGSH iron-sulfur domain-containing protein n=1 Tax=Nocardioides sp. Bht2 TaxID=3392297 RepID=UPI0039B5B99E